jgi:hypothetical protein
MDWVCKAQDPRKFFDDHPSFFVAELLYFFLCSLTFIHGKLPRCPILEI